MSLRKEFEQVQKLIVKLSNRQFDKLPSRQKDTEVVSAYIENLVMLGEELNETTVSRGYFQDIFNSVSDIILITDTKGFIITANKAMDKLCSTFSKKSFFNSFNEVFNIANTENAFAFLKKGIKGDAVKMNIRLGLRNSESKVYHCNFCRLKSEQKFVRYLALIKDITEVDQYQRQLQEAAEKFKQIFDKSSDGLLILDKKGFILEMNLAASFFLDFKRAKNNQANLRDLIKINNRKISSLITKAFAGNNLENIEVEMFAPGDSTVDCLLSTTPIYENKKLTGHQIVIKNISVYKEYNLKLMHLIEESQERERKRIATDLHDSIGQQLSGIKFMVNSLIGISENSKGERELLTQMNRDIFRVLDELRQICFDLMPRSLEKFGLIKTLEEHFQKIRKATPKIIINFRYPKTIPAIPSRLEVSIYRIVQEFVNNSLKYSKCSIIEILFDFEEGKLFRIVLKDDGRGFNPTLPKHQKGMGLSNMQSRVKAFKGSIDIESNQRTGTIFKIEIPQSNYDYHH
jgi:PAS domain S-box-containing protein